MTIPFRVKLLTPTAKAPERANESDLWDLFADSFCSKNLQDLDHTNFDNYTIYHEVQNSENNPELISFFTNELNHVYTSERTIQLEPQGRILVKTGIAIELPRKFYFPNMMLIYEADLPYKQTDINDYRWWFDNDEEVRATIVESVRRRGNHDWLNVSNYVSVCLRAFAVADIRPRSGLALKHGITVLNTPGTIDHTYRKEIGVILYNAGHQPYTIIQGDKIAQMLIRPLYPSAMKIVQEINETNRGGYGSTGK